MKSNVAVYTVRSCSFTCGGQYDVSSVDLTAQLDDVPVCTVGIAPQGGSSGKATVHTLDLGSLKDVYDNLSKKAASFAKATLKIEIDGTGPAGSNRSRIDLSDWILAGVGLSRVSTTGPFSLECVIAHPAYVLKTCAGFLHSGPNPINPLSPTDKTSGVTDIVAAGKIAVACVAEANKDRNDIVCDSIPGVSVGAKTADEVKDDMNSALEKLAERLGTLKWDAKFSGAGGGVPFASVLGDERFMRGVKYAMIVDWIGYGSGSSPWDSLTSILGEYCLNVIPTYTEKTLTVAPANPWMKPAFDIPDYYVSQFTAPGLDMDPTYGMTVTLDSAAVPADGTTTFDASESTGVDEPKTSSSTIAFVPDASVVGIGAVKSVPVPKWFGEAKYVAACGETVPADDVDAIASGDLTFDPEPEPIPPSGENPDLKTWNTVLSTYLANRFMTSYRASVHASMLCPFMPNWNGSTLIPGKTATFTSGKQLFSGQIYVVHHHIDCATSTASTSIGLRNCAAGGSISSVLGKSPSPPMY